MEISKETEGKWKQLCRLLISYNDFKHAADIAHYFIKGDYVVDRQEWDTGDYYERKTIGEALNEALIVSYARPFSGNDKKVIDRVPDLSGRVIRLLDVEGRKAHELAMSKRNKLAAHSDSDAWEMQPHTVTLEKGRQLVAPISNDTLAPLPVCVIQQLAENCGVFMEAIIKERKSLEAELKKHMPEVGIYEGPSEGS